MGTAAVNLARTTSLVEQIYYAYGYTQNNELPAGSSGPWRPPQWASSNEPIFWIVPVQQGAVGPQQLYAFDGPMEIDHEQQSVVTLNPIQTGAPIGDHAYVVPARLVAHLLMSDSMQSFIVGQFVKIFGQFFGDQLLVVSLRVIENALPFFPHTLQILSRPCKVKPCVVFHLFLSSEKTPQSN